jgi:Rho GDP-dissociation inhibitor
VLTRCCISTGYKLGEKKTAEELAALDAEDESLAKWKASLGIGAGGSAHTAAQGPQVRRRPIPRA